jgi:hypothetical protein
LASAPELKDVAMGKVTVTVDAEIKGKHFELQFDWFGGAAEIDSTMKDMEEAARRQGTSAKALSQRVLQYLPSMGLLEDPGQRQFQLMAIAWVILQLPTENAGRPGFVHNHVADEEIVANLIVRDNGVRAELRGWQEEAGRA